MHDPGGHGKERGGPTMSQKADKKLRQAQSSLKKITNIEGRGKRRAFHAAGQTPQEELGGYLARDPLGAEVAELDAQAQASLRR